VLARVEPQTYSWRRVFWIPRLPLCFLPLLLLLLLASGPAAL
jgi:hypothetical protein